MNTLEELIINPFINNTVLKINDIELTKENIKLYFNKLYILCKKNNCTIIDDIYYNTIPKKIFENINQNLILYETSVNILTNNIHYNNIILHTDTFLSQYNILNYKLDSINIVLPIFNIEFNNIINCNIKFHVIINFILFLI